jgi:hypothetical protein
MGCVRDGGELASIVDKSGTVRLQIMPVNLSMSVPTSFKNPAKASPAGSLLVVDGEAVMCNPLNAMLKLEGYEVRTAASGAAADWMRDHRADLHRLGHAECKRAEEAQAFWRS